MKKNRKKIVCTSTFTLDVMYDDIAPITNLRKLDVNSWEEIRDLVASEGGTLIGPFQGDRLHKEH